jgi:hypothetical protein
VQVISLNVDPVAFQNTFADLATSVTATVTTETGGTSSASEVQKIAFDTDPVAGTMAITLPQDTRSVTAAVVAGVFTTTANHGFAVGQPVVGTGFTNEANWTEGTTYYVAATPSPTTFTIAATSGGAALITASADAGTGTITTPARTTDEISATATFTTIASALQSLDTIGDGNVTVSGIAGEYLLLSFTGEKANANFPAVTVEDANLIPLYGKTGEFNLSTFAMQDLLDDATGESVELRFEIELTESGNVQTTGATADVTEDIIKSSATSPTPLPGLSAYGVASISSGAQTGTVTFSTATTATPITVQVSVEVPSGEGRVYAVLRAGTLSTTGFAFDLSGVTDSANYKLHYYAIC